eukprot:GHRR01012233.1.p1 GENE.GHRR01012233.1~~GHRR01012233.1.p1  ORF type:complete len:174 (+),score=17.37 GHRR01012233.1:251-772(+)
MASAFASSWRPTHLRGPRRFRATATSTVHICTGKVCKKQGSQQVLKFAQDLGLTDVNIQECGCLGNCGNGPNMLLTPEEVTLGHVATPADMADILRWQLDVQLPDKQLKATEVRPSNLDLQQLEFSMSSCHLMGDVTTILFSQLHGVSCTAACSRHGCAAKQLCPVTSTRSLQ